jgi:hypothetical protein
MAPEAAECRRCGVAPGQQEHAHDANIFGEEAQDNPRAEEVRDDAVPAVDFGLAHQRSQEADVQAVDLPVSVADEVGGGDGDEHGEQHGVDVVGLAAGAVEEEGDEADGDVEDFAGDLVPVDLRSISSAVKQWWLRRLLTNDRHFWWMGISPSGLGLLLISRQ